MALKAGTQGCRRYGAIFAEGNGEDTSNIWCGHRGTGEPSSGSGATNPCGQDVHTRSPAMVSRVNSPRPYLSCTSNYSHIENGPIVAERGFDVVVVYGTDSISR